MNERSAETIIADWLMSWVGDKTPEGHLAEAESIIRWLRDEKWDLIRRERLIVLIAVAEAAREFVLDLDADGGGDLDKLRAALWFKDA